MESPNAANKLVVHFFNYWPKQSKTPVYEYKIPPPNTLFKILREQKPKLEGINRGIYAHKYNLD